MKEIFDAVSTRIKAPYFGYALLAFISLNWRGLFLLSVTNGNPQERLKAFDSQTDAWSLIVLPLFIGALVTLVSPWIRLGFGYLAKRPFEYMDNLNLDSEHKKNIRKTQLEQSRADFFAGKESELIKRAKRDEEILEIEDAQLKEKLKQEIDALRREREKMSVDLGGQSEAVHMSTPEREILKAAAQDKSGSIMIMSYISGRIIQAGSRTFGEGGGRDLSKYDSALKNLVSKNLVSAVGHKGEMFELTHAGWQLADEL
ncbi:hypothetical protein FHY16_000223 [Xanthomonas campestris]|uniref:hypothetical protein n=1 Tax=Xanthomonas euroxanthea TaxID=2259622 RepID=UPI00160A636D|nr:hypothetical protein [Xanthomonas euroxanthea]MBB3777502.1 hypothetical protein [Xanthomonas euroxanthea]